MQSFPDNTILSLQWTKKQIVLTILCIYFFPFSFLLSPSKFVSLSEQFPLFHGSVVHLGEHARLTRSLTCFPYVMQSGQPVYKGGQFTLPVLTQRWT